VHRGQTPNEKGYMITCKEAVTIMSSDNELSVFGKMSLRFHLLICGSCSRFREHMAILKSAVRKLFLGLPRLTEAEKRKLEDEIIARLNEKKDRK
jgi:hypothetical protein